MRENNQELFEKYYSDGTSFVCRRFKMQITHLRIEALQAKIGTLSLEQQSKLEKDTAKKEAKAEAKAEAALKKKMASQVRFYFIRRSIPMIQIIAGSYKTHRTHEA